MSSPTVPPPLQRLAAQAARDPERVLMTRAQLIEDDVLREAYRQSSQSSAPGLDGGTAQASAEHLDEHRWDLYERRCGGRDQAAPVERVWSAKADGGRRPIGQPAVEDKMVPRAGAMLLEAIDEQDFHACS